MSRAPIAPTAGEFSAQSNCHEDQTRCLRFAIASAGRPRFWLLQAKDGGLGEPERGREDPLCAIGNIAGATDVLFLKIGEQHGSETLLERLFEAVASLLSGRALSGLDASRKDPLSPDQHTHWPSAS